MDAPARYDLIKNRGKPHFDNNKRWSDAYGVVTIFLSVGFIPLIVDSTSTHIQISAPYSVSFFFVGAEMP